MERSIGGYMTRAVASLSDEVRSRMQVQTTTEGWRRKRELGLGEMTFVSLPRSIQTQWIKLALRTKRRDISS